MTMPTHMNVPFDPHTGQSMNCYIDLVSQWPYASMTTTWRTCPHCGWLHLSNTDCPCTRTVHVMPAAHTSGWSCPKCGRVWGPTVTGCEKCNQP